MGAASLEEAGWRERVGGDSERGALRRAMEEQGLRARRGGLPRRILHLFAGPRREGGSLREAFEALGWEVIEIDVLQGGGAHDVCDDAVFAALLRRIRRGEFGAVIAGTPCSTFSVARMRPGSAKPLRGRRGQALGLPSLSLAEVWKVHEANTLAARAAVICEEVASRGGEFMVENPIDRGDPRLHWVYSEPDHCPLWELPVMQRLQRATGGSRVHFPQCAFEGALFQKWTTLLTTFPRCRNDVGTCSSHRRGVGEVSEQNGVGPTLLRHGIGVGEMLRKLKVVQSPAR